MKIGITGCAGRMGKALIEAVYFNENTTLSGGTVRAQSTTLGQDLGFLASIDPIGIHTSSDVTKLFEISDAVIDFTTPEASLEHAKIAASSGTSLICGTTGFSTEQLTTLKNHANKTSIVWGRNMSVGVNVLQALVTQVAQMLDDDYDIEVLEMHHRHKVDAPSGTALLLGEAAAEGREKPLNELACKSRDGIIGARPRGEIGFATLRGGDVVGDHTVIFAGDGERIELTHKASSRTIFAKGALRAALWAEKKGNGFYSMQDVLLADK